MPLVTQSRLPLSPLCSRCCWEEIIIGRRIMMISVSGGGEIVRPQKRQSIQTTVGESFAQHSTNHDHESMWFYGVCGRYAISPGLEGWRGGSRLRRRVSLDNFTPSFSSLWFYVKGHWPLMTVIVVTLLCAPIFSPFEMDAMIKHFLHRVWSRYSGHFTFNEVD